MSERITWELDGRGGYARIGRICDVELFTIQPLVIPGQPEWDLRVKLPGSWRSFAADDETELMKVAERILVAFVEKIGARF